MVAGAAHLGLIASFTRDHHRVTSGSPAARDWRGARHPVLRSAATICVTPRGREAGEIPAQSRYGEHPFGGASPVADLTVHARTFERKVGRIVRSTG